MAKDGGKKTRSFHCSEEALMLAAIPPTWNRTSTMPIINPRSAKKEKTEGTKHGWRCKRAPSSMERIIATVRHQLYLRRAQTRKLASSPLITWPKQRIYLQKQTVINLKHQKRKLKKTRGPAPALSEPPAADHREKRWRAAVGLKA